MQGKLSRLWDERLRGSGVDERQPSLLRDRTITEKHKERTRELVFVARRPFPRFKKIQSILHGLSQFYAGHYTATVIIRATS